MLSSLDHHELLVFWAELLVIYAVARLLGAGARRLGLPSVVGELTAGVVLGPSLFGSVWEGGFDWFLPGPRCSRRFSSLSAGSARPSCWWWPASRPTWH